MKTLKTNITLLSTAIARPQPRNLSNRLKTKARNEQRMRVWQRDNARCQHCNTIVPFEDYELDHITPVSLGGEVSDSNTQTLCIACHKQKTISENKNRNKHHS